MVGSRPGLGRSRRGIEPSRPHVYGCWGRPNTASTPPCSTIRPAYITATRLGDLRDHAHVVRDDDHRRSVLDLEAIDQREDLGLDRHVERGGRLVGDQQVGVARERHRDHHALAHAAGELVGVVVDPPRGARDADRREQVDGTRVRGAAREPLVRAQHLLDLPADLVDRVQRGHRVLEDHRDLGPAHALHLGLREPHQVAALVQDLAFEDRVRVADQLHDRHHRDALARAGLADDAEHVPGLERERDAVDRAHDAVLGAERHAQVAHVEERLAHVGRIRGSRKA